jgi:hypothetical protein
MMKVRVYGSGVRRYSSRSVVEFPFLIANLTFLGLFIPGYFFNSEHSPYLFHMFSFKKHRSMHVCNHVTKVTKISTYLTV